MRNRRSKAPSESWGFPKGGLVPLWRRVVSSLSERQVANPHFPQKMHAPWEVFGC